MSYKDFARDYRAGRLGDVLYFYGEENFLMRWAQELVIQSSVGEAERAYAVTELDETATADRIAAAAGSYAMFAEKRLVLVRNYAPLHRKSDKQETEALLHFLESGQNASVLLFVLDSLYYDSRTAFSKKLEKRARSYDFTRLKRSELAGFIEKRVRGAGKSISGKALAQLIDLSGYYHKESAYTLDELESDLAKLVQAEEDKEIRPEIIEELLLGDRERFVFSFVDALMSGDRTKAMTLLSNLLTADPDGDFALLSLLTRQFEMMMDALELSVDGLRIPEIARATGANEYRLRRASAAAQSIGRERTERALYRLYEADRRIKEGEIDAPTFLSLFVLAL